MRRPPVVVVIVAVLLTGVGVGWAAGSDFETAEPSSTEGAPRMSVDDPEIRQADTSTAAAEDFSVEVAVVPVETAAAPIEVTGLPGHLEQKAAPVEPEAEPVAPSTPTTTTTIPLVPRKRPIGRLPSAPPSSTAHVTNRSPTTCSRGRPSRGRP